MTDSRAKIAEIHQKIDELRESKALEQSKRVVNNDIVEAHDLDIEWLLTMIIKIDKQELKLMQDSCDKICGI